MRRLLDFPKKIRAVPVVLSLTAFSLVAFAQDRPLGAPPFGDKHVGGDKPIDERMTRQNRNPPGPEDRVLKNGVLAPSKEDRANYAAFLKMPDTGLIRLLVRESVSYQKDQPIVPGGGARYSFAHLTHFSGYGSDVELRAGKLFAGSPLGYGFLTSLGNVALEQVTLGDSRTRFIAGYRPAKTYLEARAETLRFQDVVINDGLSYRTSFPFEVGATYLLRSINYGKSVFVPTKSSGSLDNAYRTDVLVGFKVVREGADGSLIIAWRLLKKYSAPRIE